MRRDSYYNNMRLSTLLLAISIAYRRLFSCAAPRTIGLLIVEISFINFSRAHVVAAAQYKAHPPTRDTTYVRQQGHDVRPGIEETGRRRHY